MAKFAFTVTAALLLLALGAQATRELQQVSAGNLGHRPDLGHLGG